MVTPPRLRRLSDAVLRALTLVLDRDTAIASPALARGVAELSRLFTRERSSLGPPYWADPALRRAYLAYFFPVNLAKVQALLNELPEDWGQGQGREEQRAISVLDLGCGPGTAALGLLDWVAQGGPSWRVGTVIAVDRAEPALEDCRRLWEVYRRGASRDAARLITRVADLERSDLLHDPELRRCSPYELIVLANTLNELFADAWDPVEPRAALVAGLLDLLQPDGTVMLIEPALRETSRALHRLRDQLVESGACTVYSPCLHERPCPALVRETDWCHEERPWEPPPLVAALDRAVGLIKDALKFSYLLLRKDGRTIAPRAPTIYRVVSELRVMKGDQRAWLCNETGRPEVGRLDRERSPANAAMDAWHRGMIVKIDQIVRKDRRGRASTVGRIPAEATVEIVRPV
ncbi:small ribosomal subunit Rsm22 family protein [Nitrospira sp. Kam-Ns4a]